MHAYAYGGTEPIDAIVPELEIVLDDFARRGNTSDDTHTALLCPTVSRFGRFTAVRPFTTTKPSIERIGRGIRASAARWHN